MRNVKADTAAKNRAVKEKLYVEHLGDTSLQSMADGTSSREFERGETLFREDNPWAGLHIIYQGRQDIIRSLQERVT